jgi:hypothetical protein
MMLEDFIPKKVLDEFEKIDKEKQLSMRKAIMNPIIRTIS